ncbi:MAG: PAS domain S-box protein, partial [Planctomycetales bacterium]|nr:PAS domain S-box protein [Planctomycetales bacterium]
MNSRRVLVILVVLLATGIFALDTLLPVDVATGTLYMAVVLVALKLPRREDVVMAALLCAFLIVADLFLSFVISNPGSDTHQLATNSLLALLTIGVVGALGFHFKDLEVQRVRGQDELERRVQQRTADLTAANEALQTEIAERHRAELKLTESESQYHSLVDNLSVHVLRKDRDGRFTFVSQSFCELLGRDRDEVLGRTDFDFFPHHLAS